MQKKFNFTQQRIEGLSIPENGRVDYYDTKLHKLTCRVSNTGNKSFVVIKKNAAGKTQRITLGKWPDLSVSAARKLAERALSDLSSGVDVIAEKKKARVQSITLSQLLDDYIDRKQLKPLTEKDYRKKLNEGFSDWLDKPAKAITETMIQTRHRKLTESGITSRDNKMRVLRLLLRYAQAKKVIDDNPIDSIRHMRLWSKPKRKDRIIPAEKLADWYQAVSELPNEKAKVYLLVLLYTGVRANEALNLKWKDVDLKKDTFLVRDTKNGSDFSVNIPTQLKPYIQSLKQPTGGGQFVFPANGDDKPMYVPQKPILRVCEKIGLEFSSHDLRRTFATLAESSLLPETIIKRLLNHKMTSNVTHGYIQTEADTLRQATQKIADNIQSRVNAGQDSKIVVLKR